jgi:sulfur-oxidizing protein SoxY
MRSRRRFLNAAGGLAAVALLSPRASAQLTRTPLNNMPEIIRRLTGGAVITPGRVKLDVPPLVENGVTVESPMTASDYVSEIHVFTDKNPLPEMISFHLGPRAGRASIATRVRLADTENVVAIARMSDGSYWSDTAFVIVTMAACLEEL